MGFLSKIRNKMRKRVSRMPRRPGMIRDMRFRGEMPRRGGFGNLRNLVRRLKEQRDMGMPRRPSTPGVDDGRVYAGGSPGLYRPGGRFYNPRNRLRKPLGLTQELPEVAPVGMMAGRTLQQDFPAEPRMMMQAGDEVSPEQEIFSLQTQLENLQEQLRMDRSYNDDQAVINTSAEMAAIQRRIQEILQESGRTISDMDRALMGGRTMSDLDRQMGRTMSNLDMSRPQLAGGGDFPDLTGDGKVTQADILKGRGVDLKAEGGEMMTQENEIDAMLGGMGSEVEGAMESMEDLEQMAPEMEMIDQLVTMVVQMIQQGASEEEVMMFLREQGLDDEDIGTVLQLVADMAESEAMPQDGIGAELEQLA